MDMTGERRIPATREKVWAALNDPDILKASIPGCETLVKESDTDLRATASVKIGPISAKFAGKVQLLDLDPPNGYRIAGEGQGGVAGFAKGGATVNLTQDGEATILTYDVKAQVGGKIAQLGARLIDATAKQMADAFFDRFAALVSPVPTRTMANADPFLTDPDVIGAAVGGRPLPPTPAPMPAISLFSLIPSEIMGFPLVAWGGGVVFLAIMVLMFGSML
jgi:carbon monoxide dehydrogenase subunit G